MKCRVVYKLDKTVAVIHPVPKSKRLDETEEQWLKRVFDKPIQPQYNDSGQQVNPLYGCPYDDTDNSKLPSREDRDAWEGEKGKGIIINQEKAKEIRDKRELEIKIQEKIREMAIKELEKEESE